MDDPKPHAADPRPSSDLLSAPEAARLLGLTRQAVNIAIRRGRLAARKIGRNWTIEREEALRYERERWTRQ